MKKLLIIFLSLLLCNVIHAQKITEQQALEKAKAFMKDKVFSNRGKSLKRAMDKDNYDAFYIFNSENDNGFVIVSGDERTTDILGYSDKGHIDLENIPENLLAWLNYYNKEIQLLDSGQKQYVKRANKAAVAPLIQTKWNQNEPYNRMCPEKNGEKCPSGCVATAIAQVMYYYKWPTVETAEMPEYWAGCADEYYPSMPATTFDWDNMKLEYNSNNGMPDYSDKEANAVANLMRYCGQAVSMEYENGGSSASVVGNELCFRFWYSYNIKRVQRSNYSTTEWEEMMYNEIKEGRPILYSGRLPGAGHEFICDGYDGNGLFHINWGWGGGSDGFYVLNILDLNYEGVLGGYSSEGFSMGQEAIIGIEPNYAVDTHNILIFNVKSMGWNSRPSLDKDLRMSISLNAFYAYNLKEFKGEYCLAVFRNGQLTETILPNNGTIYDNNSTATIEFLFGANWAEECTVKLFYRADSSEEWKDTHLWSYDYSPNDMIIGDCINNFPIINTWGHTTEGYKESNMTINSVTFDNELVSGVKNFATINVTNTGDSYELPIYVYIDNKMMAGGSAWLSPQETGEIRISFTPESAGEKIFDIHATTYVVNNNDGTIKEVIKTYFSETITISLGTKLDFNGIYYNVDWQNKELEILSKPDYSRYSGDFIIPESVNYDGNTYKVTSIGESAFANCYDLTSITIPNSVTSIKNLSFYGCKGLTSLTIPNSVTSIGYSAFMGCTGLTSLTIPASVAFIDKVAFSDCNFSSIVVEDENINYDSRENCNAIIHTASNTLILGCKETIIPNSVTGIDYRAFGNCKGLSSIIIPQNVIVIGTSTFEGCKDLTSIEIPKNAKTIMRNAFKGCTNLASVTLPKSVTFIGNNAFGGCVNLKAIYNYATEPIGLGENISPESSHVFEGIDKDLCILYVPKNSVEKYQAAEGWKEFKQIMPLPTASDIISGDANGDSEVNVADIVEIVNFILGKPSAKFLETAADLNGDGEINVSDIVKLVSIIMSTNNVRQRSPMVGSIDHDELMLAESEDNALSLCLNNENCYVASQFDVRLSDGLSLNSIMLNNGRRNGHLMAYSAIGENLYRVIIYSPENNPFVGNSGELLKIKTEGTGDVEISNILFITSNQSEKTFSKLHYAATMIQTLETSEPMDVYSLDGRQIRKQVETTDGLKKGIYIINRQKIIIN